MEGDIVGAIDSNSSELESNKTNAKLAYMEIRPGRMKPFRALKDLIVAKRCSR